MCEALQICIYLELLCVNIIKLIYKVDEAWKSLWKSTHATRFAAKLAFWKMIDEFFWNLHHNMQETRNNQSINHLLLMLLNFSFRNKVAA